MLIRRSRRRTHLDKFLHYSSASQTASTTTGSDEWFKWRGWFHWILMMTLFFSILKPHHHPWRGGGPPWRRVYINPIVLQNKCSIIPLVHRLYRGRGKENHQYQSILLRLFSRNNKTEERLCALYFSSPIPTICLNGVSLIFPIKWRGSSV